MGQVGKSAMVFPQFVKFTLNIWTHTVVVLKFEQVNLTLYTPKMIVAGYYGFRMVVSVPFPPSVICCLFVHLSLREIFPTDAGQLSDKLKFLAGQNKILQDRRLVSNYYLVLPEITGHLSDKLNFSAGQNENLPVLSDSPAVFAKTAICIFISG